MSNKIIKHTFVIPNLVVKDGELVEGQPIKKTYTFTLLFKGIGLYEEITGQTLFNSLLASVDEDLDKVKSAKNLVDKDFIKNLASVSYVKIDGERFHNNRATVDEFRKSQVFPLICDDMNFITKLLSMAMDCIYQDTKSKSKQGAKNSKK